MNMNGEENLKNLFEKFLNSEQANQAVEDVRKGEQILREHTAPQPDGELIAGIKSEIAASLHNKREKAFIYKAAAVAAGFIILAIMSVKLFETEEAQPPKPVSSLIMPNTVWESERLADDDAASATLVDEVKQIENDLFAAQFGDNGSTGYETVTELEIETELTEISSDFWKG